MSARLRRMLDSAAEALHDKKYDESIRLLTKALVEAEKNGSADDRFEALTALGCVSACAGHRQEAEHYYARALTLGFMLNEVGPYSVASCMASLANVYFDLGRYEESRQAAMKAAAILEKDHGQDRVAVLLPLDTLTRLCLRDNDFDNAAMFVDTSVSVLNRYSSVHKDDFIAPLQKRIRELPAEIPMQYGSKWKSVQQEQEVGVS